MLEVTRDASLRELNTMGIDCTARAVVRWSGYDDLHRFFTDPSFTDLASGRVKAIGQGSNLLFTDERFEGTILLCTDRDVEMLGDAAGTVALRVHAGCPLDDFVALTCERGLWGVENLSLIPGTAGGATVQNVGAYGQEWGQHVVEVGCYDRETDREVKLKAGDMHYAYRESVLKHVPLSERLIVMSTVVKLSEVPAPCLGYGSLSSRVATAGGEITPAVMRDIIIGVRNEKLPRVGETGSAGSFFRNPVVSPDAYSRVLDECRARGIDPSGVPAHQATLPDGSEGVKLSAAWLIDKSGWKGVVRGNVATWKNQPLVLVNHTGRATGAEVSALAADIVADIESKWGITLVPEAEYL